jgi:6-phosphofructokinase
MTNPGKKPRVGIVFAGGPAPAANAVIAAAASACKRAGCDVIGLLQGYSRIVDYTPGTDLLAGIHYKLIENRDLRGLRNARGIVIGTARSNPGGDIKTYADLEDPAKCTGLRRVYDALCALELDALISIGGDGTLRTANLLYEYQQRMPKDAHRVRVVHVPKTIDNDYGGIDFTFGFFTAVDVMAKEVLNLRADAIATQSYYIVATMGRRAGWLAYGVAVAGEAHLVVGVEDIAGKLLASDGRMDLDAFTDHIVDLFMTREQHGKRYGTIVLAEGLAELLPDSAIADAPRDPYGNISFSNVDLGRMMAARTAARYKERTGKSLKVTGVQLGYESRCAAPHGFDVLLGSQLGLGAYRALFEEGLDGCMVSTSGQLSLRYVPFDNLINSNLTTTVRYITPGSDFHQMAQTLGTRVEPQSE